VRLARERRRIPLLAAVAALYGCAGAGAAPTGAGAAPTGAGAASTAELEALYRARTDSALARHTEADADFMTRMIGHHGQALEMAGLAPSRSASPEVQRLAERITAAQESEIALMRQWLEERGRAAPATAHGDSGHAMGSPGMLTPDQMRELAGASGGSFDRLFLTFMIQHHEGAVRMVDDLFATPGAARDASTFRIASGIQVDQRSEIARMQSMLEAFDPPGAAR